MALNYHGKTDRGMVKEINEDYGSGFLHSANVLFLMVADGFGTPKGGVVPSAVVHSEFKRYIDTYLTGNSMPEILDCMGKAVYMANRALINYRSANKMYAGIGCSLTVAALTDKREIAVAHVGNGRIYVLRNGSLLQATTDHTEAQAMVDRNEITKEEMRKVPERFSLTNGLGRFEDVKIDLFPGTLMTDDILMLCTDGIYDMMTEEEMAEIIISAGSTDKACEWLIEGANERGGPDNSAVILSYINF